MTQIVSCLFLYFLFLFFFTYPMVPFSIEDQWGVFFTINLVKKILNFLRSLGSYNCCYLKIHGQEFYKSKFEHL